MTTTVRKGAGRPKATERSNKAAQRTPLPPRPGQITDEMLKQAAHRIDLENMTAVNLRAYTREKGYKFPGISKMPKDELLREIWAVETSESDQIVAPRDTVKPPVEKAPQNAKQQDKPQKAMPTKQAEKASGTRSEIKAAAFCEEAIKLGWTWDLQTEGESTTATVKRGDESIEISWLNGVFQGETCVYHHTGRGNGIKIHNASAAKKRMAVSPEVAADEARKVTAHKATRGGARKTTDAKARRPKELPFTEASLDDEVIAALRGKEVTWLNSISGTEESTRVPDTNDRSKRGRVIAVTMREDESGRSINFAGQGGFRSIRISSITEVK